MTDSYYYQDNSGQIVGPLTPQALKQLANQGVVNENTLVRKGEQGAWYLASTIAGLLPSRPAGSERFYMPEKDPAERARQAFQKAEEHADKVAAKLWFLDLKFARFFTPKLAGALGDLFVSHNDRVLHLIFRVARALAQPSVRVTKRNAARARRAGLRRRL